MSYWDMAYQSGVVPWDPGPYDGNLPAVIERHAIGPCRVVDIGCGTGGSLIWLAGMGYHCTGIEGAPAAIRQAQAKSKEAGTRIEWLVGSFPHDFAPPLLPDGSFDLVIDRGWFHLYTEAAERAAVLAGISRILAPGGLWYSLIAGKGGERPLSGPPRWSEAEVRSALSGRFEILELRASVFTPSERGSMPAWISVARRQDDGADRPEPSQRARSSRR